MIPDNAVTQKNHGRDEGTAMFYLGRELFIVGERPGDNDES